MDGRYLGPWREPCRGVSSLFLSTNSKKLTALSQPVQGGGHAIPAMTSSPTEEHWRQECEELARSIEKLEVSFGSCFVLPGLARMEAISGHMALTAALYGSMWCHVHYCAVARRITTHLCRGVRLDFSCCCPAVFVPLRSVCCCLSACVSMLFFFCLCFFFLIPKGHLPTVVVCSRRIVAGAKIILSLGTLMLSVGGVLAGRID